MSNMKLQIADKQHNYQRAAHTRNEWMGDLGNTSWCPLLLDECCKMVGILCPPPPVGIGLSGGPPSLE